MQVADIGMVNEQKIQQLVIDRNKDSAFANTSLYLGGALILVVTGLLVLWLYTAQNATGDEVSKQPVIESLNTLSPPEVGKNKLPLTPTPTSAALPSKAAIVLDASGHVVARRIATVSSRVTGKLNALYIEEGIRVKKSAVLAELDDVQANISYQISLASLAAQQASYQETLIRQQYAQQKLKRRQLLEKTKLISTQLTEDSQLNVAQLNAQLANKLAQIDLAKQRSALAHYQLEQHKIRAPFNGVVIRKNAQVGELISAGGSGGGTIRTGVGTIVDMSSLEVEVEVGESYINRVTEGQTVIATLDAYPQWQIKSEVIAVIPTADRQKASIKVRIKLHEIDSRVLPDMGVKVSFLANEIVARL